VKKTFHDLWSNDDARKNELAAHVMQTKPPILGEGIVGLEFNYKPHFLSSRGGDEVEKASAAGS
jgi:hypothetical protein